jgi:predicted DNA-binding transcriptional regulator AlpA
MATDSELLNEVQAALFLGVVPGTLSVWRSVKRYPLAYVKVGRLVKYRKSDLEMWLASRTVSCDAAKI